MAPKRIVHIGVGPWGRNYLKTYEAFPIAVSVATRDSWKAMLEDRPAGVVICTPPQTHVEIAQFALERDIPVMIEKPLALSLREAESLLAYTAPILVDHIYLFSDAYQALKDKVKNRKVRHIETVGMGGKGHTEYSVLWDYGPHDIAMVLDLMGREPGLISAKEVSTPAGVTFEVELQFGEIVTHSRFGVAPVRERRVLVECEDGRESFDDTNKGGPGPLHTAVGVFLSSIEGKIDSRVGLGLALKVLRVLEACERSCHLSKAVQY